MSLSDVKEGDCVIHTRATLQVHKPEEMLLELDFIKSRAIRFIIFPDWQQEQDELYAALIEVVRSLAVHPDRQQIVLLVDKTQFPTEAEISVEEMFYEITLHLLLTESIDVVDSELEISFIESLSSEAYAALLSQISYQISLPQEHLTSLEIDFSDRLARVSIDELLNLTINENRL